MWWHVYHGVTAIPDWEIGAVRAENFSEASALAQDIFGPTAWVVRVCSSGPEPGLIKRLAIGKGPIKVCVCLWR